MSDLQLDILSRSGRNLATVKLSSNSTTADLKNAFAKCNRQYKDINRHYFTTSLDPKSRTVLGPETVLSNVLKSGDSVYFKDLGPQISWKTVFHVEYVGPLIIHLVFYIFPKQIYKLSGFNEYEIDTHKHHSYFNLTQQLGFSAIFIHYIKREFETHFVHRFSNSTMPLFNIFKNSFHYWILCGANIAYYLYHPRYQAPFNSPILNYSLFGLFLIFEAFNLQCHLILRNLRPAGTRKRGIPQGSLFEYVSCGNYTAEIAAWFIFCIMVNTLTSWIFLIVSTAQISLWALKKHKQYKKEFGKEYPRKRKVLFPFMW